MSLLAVELHDAGVAAVAAPAAESSEGTEPRLLGPPSPGFALLEGEELRIGVAAAERRRLAPRRTHHHFWHALDARRALPRPFPREWMAADLAHAHLEALWREIPTETARRVVLAVPGSFEPEQLGLVLGICRAAGIPVTGLVDLALAAAVGSSTARRVLHFDLHLHRGVVTELQATASGGLVRRSVRTVEGAGRVALEDAWARAVAGVFVHSTRFDPFHAPHTEQALYHRLAPWLEGLERSDSEVAPFTLELGGEERTVELSREGAVAAVAELYERLVEPVRALASSAPDDGPPELLLSSHATGLPGLAERLEAAGVSAVLPLSPGAAGRGALTVSEAILQGPWEDPMDASALPLLLRLPPPAADPPQTRTGAPDGAP